LPFDEAIELDMPERLSVQSSSCSGVYSGGAVMFSFHYYSVDLQKQEEVYNLLKNDS